MDQPFLSLYTPTYRRPTGLAACLASVQVQTAVADVEQVVVVDHVGNGIDGMYARVPDYAPSAHGLYVYMLCDDDVLADRNVVSDFKVFAETHGRPPVVICKATKGGMTWPYPFAAPPMLGHIDLGCVITRGDVWQQFCGRYGQSYEGDFAFIEALWNAGLPFVYWDRVVSVGAVSRGQAEAA